MYKSPITTEEVFDGSKGIDIPKEVSLTSSSIIRDVSDTNGTAVKRSPEDIDYENYEELLSDDDEDGFLVNTAAEKCSFEKRNLEINSDSLKDNYIGNDQNLPRSESPANLEDLAHNEVNTTNNGECNEIEIIELGGTNNYEFREFNGDKVEGKEVRDFDISDDDIENLEEIESEFDDKERINSFSESNVTMDTRDSQRTSQEKLGCTTSYSRSSKNKAITTEHDKMDSSYKDIENKEINENESGIYNANNRINTTIASGDSQGTQISLNLSEQQNDEDDAIYVYESIPDLEQEELPIIINIYDSEFLLVPYGDTEKQDLTHLVALYDDSEVFEMTIEEFFCSIRKNEDICDFFHFKLDDELLLDIPDLGGICITEDNIYSKDITIQDFVQAFHCLKSNTKSKKLIPPQISFVLRSQARFITNFNAITELIRSKKGFEYIKTNQVTNGNAESNTKSLKHGREDSSMGGKKRLKSK